MDPVLTEPNQKIEDSIHHLKVELAGIRAGRANPALIENVIIDAYGGKMKLMELGNISAPQPSLLTVQLWDASILQTVLKGIQEANLGLNPSNDGTLIRLPIPPLTAERREEIIKIVHQKLEDEKVSLRNIRANCRNAWKSAQERGEIGEDELFRREKILQDLMDKKTLEIEEIGKAKEEELTQI